MQNKLTPAYETKGLIGVKKESKKQNTVERTFYSISI